ncbi:XkdX family protein [Roseburia hominis]|uniref:XkdX family protein n=1 Tax=Roseburia hominis TaxID=301301 RepID=A0A395VGR1_9FIRM|nr:XkdX family protein [Roseburia hominis]
MQHSDWFDRIKDYYDTKRWNLAMVKNAVKKDKITEEEYEEITGRKYKA